jgi:hypothetical protein
VTTLIIEKDGIFVENVIRLVKIFNVARDRFRLTYLYRY